MSTTSQNDLAKRFRALHIPGDPLILTNVYDAITARTVASIPGTKALATASAAIAECAGLPDQSLTFELNLAAVRTISKVVKEFDLPLSVDFQDGYNERLEEGTRELINLGVVGMNLEDYDEENKRIMPLEEAVSRIQTVIQVARENKVPDFVLNARTDVLLFGGSVEKAIERGKAYLAAGATTAFVWGGPKRGGITKEEVERMSKAFGGMMNVSMRVMGEGNLGVGQLSNIGVARISTGPGMMRIAMETIRKEVERIVVVS